MKRSGRAGFYRAAFEGRDRERPEDPWNCFFADAVLSDFLDLRWSNCQRPRTVGYWVVLAFVIDLARARTDFGDVLAATRC